MGAPRGQWRGWGYAQRMARRCAVVSAVGRFDYTPAHMREAGGSAVGLPIGVARACSMPLKQHGVAGTAGTPPLSGSPDEPAARAVCGCARARRDVRGGLPHQQSRRGRGISSVSVTAREK